MKIFFKAVLVVLLVIESYIIFFGDDTLCNFIAVMLIGTSGATLLVTAIVYFAIKAYKDKKNKKIKYIAN